MIRTIQLELTNISKTIAGLLTQPLSHVVVQLRELKSSQSTKRKQLESLEARERSVLKRITSGGDDGEEEEAGEGNNHDMSFGLPLSVEGGKVTKEQRLIQTGQLTPFGGQVYDTTTDSAESALLGSSEKNDVSTSFDSMVAPSSSAALTKATPTIQLSNDSFDGLFSNTVYTKPTKKSTSHKGKLREKTSDETNSHEGTSTGELAAPEEHQDQIQENGELVNGELDMDDWMPDEAELALFESEMLSSSDSEYITDDELGSPKKKKQKPLRELSSDEEDGDEDRVVSKRRGRKPKLKRWHYQDDGDDELYRLRIR